MKADLVREVRRKAFHLGGLFYLGAYFQLGHPRTLRLMSAWMLVVAALETARLRSAPVRRFLHGIFGAIIREKESGRYTGAFYTSLGIFIVFLLYGSRPTIVSAAVCYLTFGDATSALVGKLWGKRQYRVLGQIRSVEGTSAGIAVALLCGWALSLPPAPLLAGAAAFAAADTFGFPPDDNLWIPVATGTALYLLGVQ